MGPLPQILPLFAVEFPEFQPLSTVLVNEWTIREASLSPDVA